MHHQPDLFSDGAPKIHQQTAVNSATALKLAVQDARLSPAQQCFNRLLERIDKLKGQFAEMQVICDAHRSVYHQALTPLRERHWQCMRDMVFFLDGRLQRNGLNVKQKHTATDILCNLCMQLIAQGDEEMKSLHDKHSSVSLAQKEQAAVMDMRDMIEDILGEPLTDDESLEIVQDVLRTGMERLREAKAAEQETCQQASPGS